MSIPSCSGLRPARASACLDASTAMATEEPLRLRRPGTAVATASIRARILLHQVVDGERGHPDGQPRGVAQQRHSVAALEAPLSQAAVQCDEMRGGGGIA